MIKRSSLFLILGMVFLLGCSEGEQTKNGEYLQFSGPTMGTTYTIKAESETDAKKLKSGIDSLLEAFNMQVSTYIQESVISQFNQSRDTFSFDKEEFDHFYRNLKSSYQIYEMTEGYYDPTVMPLVNYWGFGYEDRDESRQVDSAVVDSLRQLVGLENLQMQEEGEKVVLVKPRPEVQLDFSAIAKGDGVDVMADYLQSYGIENYMVEIGGEVYAKGENAMGNTWSLGINRPNPNASMTDIVEKVRLPGRGLATSGNYRNYYEVDGEMISHTINPKTGYTERNRLLSASVIADNCMRADALATASMTMGVENVKRLSVDWEKAAVFIIYQEVGQIKNWSTKEFQNYLKK